MDWSTCCCGCTHLCLLQWLFLLSRLFSFFFHLLPSLHSFESSLYFCSSFLHFWIIQIYVYFFFLATLCFFGWYICGLFCWRLWGILGIGFGLVIKNGVKQTISGGWVKARNEQVHLETNDNRIINTICIGAGFSIGIKTSKAVLYSSSSVTAIRKL